MKVASPKPQLRITKYLDCGLALALGVAALALYARTLAPGLLDGDEGEFQTNIYKLGVSHTGYPLFFLSAKLFTLLVPLGTMATRANLFSAFCGALTVAAIYLFLRWLTQSRASALVGAMLFAVSRVEWSQAVIPRVYTLNAFFVVAVTALFFLWRAGKVDLSVPVLVFGLSLTNHRTMIWFAPAIALFVVWHARAALFQPKRLLRLALAFLAPLLLYLYVPLRGNSDVGVEFHLKDFGDMILGGNVSRWMQYGPLDWVVSRVTDLYIPLLIEQFTPLGFVAGLIGAGALALNRAPYVGATLRGRPPVPPREMFGFILLANLGNSAFCIFFNTIDVEKFFIPSYLTFLFFIGVGVAVIGNWLLAIGVSVISNLADEVPVLSLAKDRLRAVVAAIAIAPFLIITAYPLTQNYARNDLSARTDIAATWNETLALPLENRALIVGAWETLTPLEYSQYVDGKRRDLKRWKVLTKKQYLGLVPYGSQQPEIEREVRAGRAVYLTEHPRETETLTELADKYRLTRVAGLWRIVNLPPVDCGTQTAGCHATKPRATFSDRDGRSIELVDYAMYPATELHAGDFVLVTLFWRARESLGARYTISARLLDPRGNVVAQRDSEPASGARPTIGWTAGEVVADDIGLFVPAEAATGIYSLAIVVYNSATIQDLQTDNGVPARWEVNVGR